MFPISGGRERMFVGRRQRGKVRAHWGFFCAQGGPRPDEPEVLSWGTFPRVPVSQWGSWETPIKVLTGC